MIRWRVALALLLIALAGVPLLLPFLELCSSAALTGAWREHGRLLLLARNTLLLIGVTVLLALPVGVFLAVLLSRTDLPGRRVLRFLVLLTVFVPLPLFASGWEAALGAGGWLSLAGWGQGLLAAAWVHAAAGLPWVVLLAGLGLCWVERDLEEDALTAAPPWRVLLLVTLPRAQAALGAAALWVALQAASEITVTDMMQVRTFAEEVYTQFVVPESSAALGRAVAVSLPWLLLAVLIVLAAVRRWERDLPPSVDARPPLLFRLGRWRWPCALAVTATVGLLAGIPLGSLVWQAGVSGTPETWGAATVLHHLRTALRVAGGTLASSLALAAVVGTACALLGLLQCWLALDGGWFRSLVLGLAVVAWALPGPVVGLGLKAAIDLCVRVAGPGVLADALYYRPSPLPVAWVQVVRLFPFALALLWPVVRLVPRDLRDAARMDAGPAGELRHVFRPLTAGACGRAALAVAALSLGELSASKLVLTPGSSTFAAEVFDQMHYRLGNDLAARCLLLLAAVTLAGTLAALPRKWHWTGDMEQIKIEEEKQKRVHD